MAVLAAGPRPDSRDPVSDLVSQTVVLTRRLVVRSARNPMTVVHAVALPVAFLLTLKVVFADSITAITGENALYRSVPLVALLATMSGATIGMVGINAERRDGFLARLWALPIHRAAAPLARLAAEAVRLMFTTSLVLATGIALGFRFHSGIIAAVLWVMIPVIFGLAFSSIVTAAALFWPRGITVEAVQPVIILGATFCTGFVPVDRYPEWVQPLVRNQPMSPAADAMRGLAVGGPVLSPLIATALWCAAMFGATLLPIIVGYRRASTGR
jgi:ABC-2 type transport system permease protein